MPLSQSVAVPKFAVQRWQDQVRLEAVAAIGTGERILRVLGREVPAPTRYSIQVGERRHLDTFGEDPADPLNAWRFLNHSCAPNARLVAGVELVALRPIARGEAVTFDYDANEWDMASPFACACSAPDCRGVIRGYRHLGATERARIAAWASAHVLNLAGEAAASAPSTRA